jgi:hypothetical protein
MAAPHDADREALIRAMSDAGVAFVVVGGVAVRTHGVDYRTQDIDFTPQRTVENAARLADALNDLRCSLVIDDDDPSADVPLPAGYFTVATLENQTFWNLRTGHGRFDIVFAPAGFPNGYDDLVDRARPLRVAETTLTVLVASLADIEHSKRTADRPKDRAYLEAVGRVASDARYL